MAMNSKIDKTKKWFDDFFSNRDEYNSQTQDEKHLEAIIHTLGICNSECRVLDIGTGTGYLSFEIAKKYKNANVTGLDIVEETLKINRDRTIEQKIQNLDFISYDGSKFPFADGLFDIIVTRYALHHFPDIKNSFSEIARVLKKGGKLLIADPIPAENDNVRFVDKYM
ncbi:MAG: class I SAM-dependent methyltransferase, partial [Ruminococcus sp.]|nr:class I SAM-dependent methyltransferase [Ruminococcus sp.]